MRRFWGHFGYHVKRMVFPWFNTFAGLMTTCIWKEPTKQPPGPISSPRLFGELRLVKQAAALGFQGASA